MLRKIMTAAQMLDPNRISMLVQLCNRFPCMTRIEKNNREVDAKSALGLQSLTISKGDEIIITTGGAKEREALETIVKILNEERLDQEVDGRCT